MTPNQLLPYLQSLLSNDLKLSTMIWGQPGIGKSSIVRQAADLAEIEFIDVRLSQLAPTDLRGLPVPENGISRWFPPEFLPREGSGILFMDEINMAPPAMQGVAQQLILDRAVGSYQLPDDWFIWAAGNRKEDRAAVFDMPSPLANRFIHLTLESSIDDFRQYAFSQGISENIIGFLAFRADLLHKLDQHSDAWPSPRSWEMANQLYCAGLDIEPAVGIGCATEFSAYLAVTQDIPDLAAILAGKKQPEFPVEPSLRYACVMGLVGRYSNAKEAVNGLRWLVNGAPAEWVQLYASDLFPQLRERKQFGAAQKAIVQDIKLKEFLTDYSKLLAAA